MTKGVFKFHRLSIQTTSIPEDHLFIQWVQRNRKKRLMLEFVCAGYQSMVFSVLPTTSRQIEVDYHKKKKKDWAYQMSHICVYSLEVSVKNLNTK